MANFTIPEYILFAPDNAPRRTVCLNAAWLSFLIGELQPYTFRRAWSGDELTIQRGVSFANEAIKQLIESCMVGQIVMFAHEDLKDNLIICDGQSFARSDYPALYGVTPSGRRIDADNARVPDLRSRFIVSTGDGGNTLTAHPLADIGGAETVTLTQAEMPVHTHTAQPHNHEYGYPNVGLDLEAPGAPDITAVANPPAAQPTTPATVIIDSAGDGESHENMPPYHALVFAIIAK